MIVEGLLSPAQKPLNATQTKEINLLGAGAPDSPDVKGRSPEDSGKEELGNDIRPRQGVALTQSVNQCDTLAGSRIACETRSTGLRGYAP